MPCDSPIVVIDAGTVVKGTYYHDQVKVPCGKCPPCKLRRVQEWVFRLLEEDKVSSSSHFITLTYKNECLPRTQNNFATLNIEDFQKFMKRLRKAHSKAFPKAGSIKYYMAGEYGSKRSRPHYHVIMFNLLDTELVNAKWQLGEVDIGTVTGASIAYTAKYIDKPKTIPQHRNDDRKREFSVMSQGLGKSFSDNPQIKKYYTDDITRNHVILEGGQKIALPKYYREKLFTEEQRKAQTVHIQKIMSEKLEQDEKDHNRNYKGNKSFDHIGYLGKEARYIKFYKNQNPRDNEKSKE